jgi:O-acetyl-ADP-ribose deacetylase (regulator of RNase III)
MVINYVKGDATRPEGKGKKIITHICNDIGAWGAGFVLAVSKRWEEPEIAYRSLKQYILGHVQFVFVDEDIIVANMIAQRDTNWFAGNPPIRYDALRRALKEVNKKATILDASIHMPRIGCGLAGGQWEEIEKLIQQEVTVEVTVYDLK